MTKSWGMEFCTTNTHCHHGDPKPHFGLPWLYWYNFMPDLQLRVSSYRALNTFHFSYAASACNTDPIPTQPHWNSNTHRTKNNTTNVVIQQKSRRPLMMDILLSETCWAHKKWNKIASDIKLVFYSVTTHFVNNNISVNVTKNTLISYWP